MSASRTSSSVSWLIVPALVFSLLIFFVLFQKASTVRSTLASTETANQRFDVPLEAFKPPQYEMRLLFGGDVMWGRQIERMSDEVKNEAYAFSGLESLNRSAYDAWIVNVECPITDEIVPFDLQWEAIQFNCPPKFVDDFAEWFDVVSLANNHTDNVNGEAGLLETRQNLERAGLQHFGHYDPSVKDQLCEVVSLPIRIVGGDQPAGKFPIALCGYHGVFRWFSEDELAVIADYSDKFITIVMPHAGAEYQPEADELRRQTYRKMIDLGADGVLGNHPHWVQDTESYKGKPIVYSMGNFIFDQQFSSEVQRSVMVEVSLTIDGAIGEWLKLAESCVEFADSCRQETDSLSDYDHRAEYNLVGTKTVDFKTYKAGPAEFESILERTNWQDTVKRLD